MIPDPKHPDFPRTKRIAMIGFFIGFCLSAMSSYIRGLMRDSGGFPQTQDATSTFFQALGSGIGMAFIFIILYAIFNKIAAVLKR